MSDYKQALGSKRSHPQGWEVANRKEVIEDAETDSRICNSCKKWSGTEDRQKYNIAAENKISRRIY